MPFAQNLDVSRATVYRAIRPRLTADRMQAGQRHPLAEPPRGEHRLDLEGASRLPATSSVYAAWIVDQQALAAAGIGGEPPVLLYVGKADGAGGLKSRLTRHAQTPWWELVDLLASRGTVLPGWWSHAQQNTTRRTLVTPPLAAVSEDQARTWQHENLLWGWTPKPKPDARAFEAALIAAHRPLLNRHGAGYKAEPPPQLRAVGPYERERAWWLFHVAWLAVLTLQPSGWARRSLNRHVVAADERGWPVPLDEGVPHRVRIPSERSAQRMLISAAPPSLRDAVANPTSAGQATAWWAAYAGNAFLEDAQSPEVALHAALARSADSDRAPRTLPSQTELERLIKVVQRLPGVTH